MFDKLRHAWRNWRADVVYEAEQEMVPWCLKQGYKFVRTVWVSPTSNGIPHIYWVMSAEGFFEPLYRMIKANPNVHVRDSTQFVEMQELLDRMLQVTNFVDAQLEPGLNGIRVRLHRQPPITKLPVPPLPDWSNVERSVDENVRWWE